MTDEAIKDSREQILRDCREQNIDRISVRFDGGGDSGQIEEITFYDIAGEQIVSDTKKIFLAKSYQYNRETGKSDTLFLPTEQTLKERVDILVEQELEATNVDWYNSDGGFGEWTLFNILSDNPTLSFDINVRVSDYYSAHNECCELVVEAAK